MLLASVALISVLVSGGVLWLAVAELGRVGTALEDARRAERRYRAWSSERRRFVATRDAIADATTGTAEAVQTIAGAVYGGISAAGQGIGRLSRRKAATQDAGQEVGQDVSPAVEAGSDPPEPPTPRAPRPG